MTKDRNNTTKSTTANGRFGASGGVARPTLECRTATSALVQTAVNPPPVAKPLRRYLPYGGQCVRVDRKQIRKGIIIETKQNIIS